MSRSLSNLSGFQGAQGINYPKGPQGDIGDVGVPGTDGETGLNDSIPVGIDITYGGTSNKYISILPKISDTSANALMVIEPEGNGFISAQIPDNGISGGNCRGNKSVDLQMSRSDANEVASGTQSCILGGQNNRVSGDFSTIIGGNDCFLTANNSAVVGGRQNQCPHSSSFICGFNNSIYGGGSNSHIIGGKNNYQYSADGIVIIAGNGAYADNQDDMIIIGGNVTAQYEGTHIGRKLHINTVNSTGTYGTYVLCWDPPGAGNQNKVQEEKSSNLTSDIRLKKDITSLDSDFFPLNKLKEMKLITFNYKEDDSPKLQYGFSAQNLLSISSHLVDTSDNGILNFNRFSIVQYLTGLIKNQNNKINDLNQRVSTLLNSI